MKSLLQEYLDGAVVSQEDHESSDEPSLQTIEVEVEVDVPEVQEVSEDQAYEAEADLGQVEADAIGVDAAQREAQVAQEQVDDHLASIDSYREVLAIGIEREEYSAQFAAMVAAALENYNQMLGEVAGAPSLEDYDQADLGEYYVASQEAFADVSKKLSNISKAIRAKIGRTFKAIGTDKGRAKSLTTKADKLLAEVSKIKTDEKVEVSLAGVANRVAVDGTIPSDLTAAVKTHNATVNGIAAKVVPALLDFGNDVARDIKKAGDLDTEEAKAIIESAKSRKDPTAGFQLGAVLGGKLVSSSLRENDRGGEFSSKSLDIEEVKPGKDAANAIELTAAQVKSVLQEVKRGVVVLDSLAGVEKKAWELARVLDEVSEQKNFAVVDGIVDMLAAAQNQGTMAVDLALGMYIDTLRSLIAVEQLVERAVKALAKADKAAAKESK